MSLKAVFPGGSAGKESTSNAEDVGSIRVQKNPLEKEIATHSSILAWEMPWTEEPGRLHTVHEVTKEVDTTEQLDNNKNNL